MNAELWEGCTAEEYRADPSVNQSGIKTFLRDPMLYFLESTGKQPRKPPTKSMQFGSDVESVAFTGQLNPPAIMIPGTALNDQGHRKGPNWSQWETIQRATYGDGVRLLKPSEYTADILPIYQAVDGLRAHEKAAELVFGDNVRRHVRIRWTDDNTGLRCKCEIDMVHRNLVLPDLKALVDVSASGMQRAVLNFGYYIQMYFYRHAVGELAKNIDALPDTDLGEFMRPICEEIAARQQLACCWVAVKNKPSHHCEVYPVEDDWFSLATPIVLQAMDEINQCRRTGRWQTRTHGQVAPLKVPTWAFNVLESLGQSEE